MSREHDLHGYRLFAGDLFICLQKRDDRSVIMRSAPKALRPGKTLSDIRTLKLEDVPLKGSGSHIMMYVCEYRGEIEKAMSSMGLSRNVIFHGAIWNGGLWWISSEDAILRPIPKRRK